MDEINVPLTLSVFMDKKCVTEKCSSSPGSTIVIAANKHLDIKLLGEMLCYIFSQEPVVIVEATHSLLRTDSTYVRA